MLFSKAREGFAFHHQVANHSRQTIAGYDAILTALEKFFPEKDPLTVEAVTRDDVQSFIVHLQQKQTLWEHHPHHTAIEKTLSPFTVHCYARALTSFFNWAVQEKLVGVNPMTGVPKPKLPQVVKPRFSENEIERLIKTCDDCRPALAARNRAIVLVLLDTGIRASELCTLTLDRLDQHLRRALIFGKGMKQRYVVMGARTREALWEYLNVHRAPKNTNCVFLTAWGRPLDKNKLAHVLKRLGDSAGVPDCHPHRFRHTSARLYLRNGGDVLTLQQMLGHESITTTTIYARLEVEDLERTHERASPVDRLGL